MSAEPVLELIRETNGLLSDEIERVVRMFQKWLFLPDPTPLLAVLGAVAANHIDGDPVWLLLVGTPGSGKSELLTPVAGLPNVYPTATLTEAALLSGSPSRAPKPA